MNIKITYNWLLDYLDTDATPDQIREYLALCGPSVESVEKVGDDYVFDIEITSNRIDTASVIGVAQEAQAILPMFGKQAKLKLNPLVNLKFDQVKPGSGFDLKVDIKSPDLVSRFTSLIFDQIEIDDSPKFIQDRLKLADVKVINNVVDISNYLMITLGQPIHMFDYDKIADHHMIVRESKKGEKLVTLDEKEIILPGGDIVIEDGSGKLIDLCGIMGGLNSAISSKTKRVLLFVQTYNKSKIRRTTMTTGQRTIAATFFEKGLDEERVVATTVSAAQLLEKYCHAKIVSQIQDIYPKKTPEKNLKFNVSLFEKIIGISLGQDVIKKILLNLGFEVNFIGSLIEIKIPVWRLNDIDIPEDIIEEVARVYGYHNIPSKLQSAVYVEQPKEMEQIFVFQNRIKTFLKHLGLNEVINYSMVSKNMIEEADLKVKDHLRLSNSLSEDIEFLRISLLPSLYKNITENKGKKEALKLFEIAKIYLPKKGGLPDEMHKVGIATSTSYFDLKGIIEAIYKELNIDGRTLPEIVERNGSFMTELDFMTLIKNCRLVPNYKPLHPYAIIKLDKTFEIQPHTTYAVVRQKAFLSKLLQKIEVVTLYQNKLTLRFYYSSSDRNITEEEAKKELNRVRP
ncbi:MAG: phenylalanine--tRNA ligase subunit beta [Candidatus Roizmanbacteria bacterium]|nr:phenylalanine--tRNA ligase subunit beta [Candidatus Roizmanbacteria bacterium]